MKQGWEIKKLGEVCYFQNGFAFKSNTFTDRGEPILRISDIQNDEIIESKMVFFNPKSYPEDLSRFLVYPNDIVIAMSGGTTGKIGINKTNKTFYLNQRVGVFRENPNLLNHQYLYYFLKTKSEESLNLAAGAAQPNLSTVQINAFEIPTPSLAEQERIVEILDKEFERIDALKANAEQNLQHAKDFFQSALKQELQPKEGWKSQTFSDEVDVINGRAYRKEELLSKGKYRVLRVGNFFTNDSWYYSDLELSDDKYCDYGDLLYAWSASFGPKIWKGEKVIYHYHIWKMVSKNGIDTHFLYYWLQSPHLTTQVMSNLHGTTMAHITKGIMESTTIQFPEKQEQNAVVARLDKLKEHCKALEENYTKTIALCDDMKQALLRKAFNGEL